jgi:rare lipoprotein A
MPKGARSDFPKTARKDIAKTASTSKAQVLSTGACGASFYSEGQMTASGERFNPDAMTAAHKSLPLGSKVRVTNPRTDESVTVRINDRGPYVGGRCLDLSKAAFSAIGNIDAGTMQVKYEVLRR